MRFVKSTQAIPAIAQIAAFLSPSKLDIKDASSIKGVARTIAADTMSYYPGTEQAFADLPQPYYWWECGALMGAMLDYSHYTQDPTYDRKLATALLAQAGPNFDYMLPKHFGDEGNDDQAFWGFAVMSAAERNFPQPDASVPSWLEMSQNLWNSLSSRWDTSACGGGLFWQIFPSNPNGMDYKNSVSNGGLFQLSARLARATGNQTYVDWARKVWDWTAGVGMIDGDFNVFDGAGASENCSVINGVSFSYSTGIYLYGAAVLANVTGDSIWVDRVEKLLEASRSFFSPFDNATNVMYEHACETVDKCNADMLSFKGYFSRFAYASTLMVPSILPTVTELFHFNAEMAAKACSGGEKGTTCGEKWYVGGYDGNTGLGQEMCALETIQGLLVAQSTPPYQKEQIKVVREFTSTAAPAPAAPAPSAPGPSAPAGPPATVVGPPASASTTPTSQANKRSNSAASLGVDTRWVVLSGLTGLYVWGML